MKSIKYTMLVVLIPIMTACGGGGSETSPSTSSSPTSQPATPTISLSLSTSQSAVSMNEGTTTSATLDIAYNGSKTLNVSVQSSSADITTSATKEKVDISSADIDGADINTTLTVTVSDGTLSDTATIQVEIVNNSLVTGKSTLTSLIASHEQFILSPRVATGISDYFIDIGALVDNITEDEATLLQQSVHGAIDDAYSTLDLKIINAQADLISQSNAGDLTDSSLAELTEYVNDAAKVFLNELNIALSQATQPVSNLVPSVAVEQFSAVPDSGNLSLYIGSASFGSVSGSSFAFYEQYAFLQAIIERNAIVCTNILPEINA